MPASISKHQQVQLQHDIAQTNHIHSPKLTRGNILIVLIAGTLAQTSFVEKFLNDDLANSTIGGIIGGYLGGALIGAIIQAPISNRYGRRVCNGTASITLVVSGSLLAGSVHIAMFIIARILTGIAAGILTSNNPVYVSKIARPAHQRPWR